MDVSRRDGQPFATSPFFLLPLVAFLRDIMQDRDEIDVSLEPRGKTNSRYPRTSVITSLPLSSTIIRSKLAVRQSALVLSSL